MNGAMPAVWPISPRWWVGRSRVFTRIETPVPACQSPGRRSACHFCLVLPARPASARPAPHGAGASFPTPPDRTLAFDPSVPPGKPPGRMPVPCVQRRTLGRIFGSPETTRLSQADRTRTFPDRRDPYPSGLFWSANPARARPATDNVRASLPTPLGRALNVEPPTPPFGLTI